MIGTDVLVAFIRERADSLTKGHDLTGGLLSAGIGWAYCPRCDLEGSNPDWRCPAMRDRDAVLALVAQITSYRGWAEWPDYTTLLLILAARWQDDMTPEQRQAWAVTA